MALPQDFWSDEIIYEPEAPPPPVYHRRAKPARHRAPKVKETATPARKPQRPLIVTVSIKNQSLKVYDANGLFAEAPVSTGMRGHATPLGIFSVIQKNKWHRSNIYSGAPMPYMQRLTWSGIAMHAGALPGYPASHGCIRMPNHFATQIWNWTRMGARVVVTSGEVSPVAFSHPLLITQKPAPQVAPPADATVPSADAAPASPASLINAAIDSAKSTDATTTAIAIDLKDLRPSLMPHTSGAAEPITTGLAADRPTKVADASATLTPPNSLATLNDGVTAPAGEAVPAATATPPVPKRTGPIAVFISGKDGKLYVRQNFEPLFDVPITVASSERPLGTHVFTAQAVPAPNDGDGATTFRWTALTMPVEARSKAASRRAAKRRHDIGAIDTEPAPTADSAAEALDRLTIPAETMTRLAEALTTGSSIIVSDQALDRSETGQGTDFIVPLR
ncbi:MAG: L,D-transpeptidase [Xanthobacteraceae bacterium]